MEELFAIKDMYALYEGNQLLVMFCVMIVAFYPLLLIVMKVIFPGVGKIIQRNGDDYRDIFDSNHLTSRIVHLFIALYLMFWGDIFDKSSMMTELFVRIKDMVISVYIIITISYLLITLINIGVDVYKTKSVSKRVPIRLHAHIVKIIVTIFTLLTIFSVILGVSISSLFTSIGAAAALLTFVFKDTVLGLLASLQLTFQDIIKVGDWVTMPSYNADGDIEKITITVVVIRNFDNTYTTVPTYAFLTTGVRNWRSMFDKGGRRIKRALSIDMDTIKICDQNALNKFKEMTCMVGFAKNNSEYFDSKNGTTNLTLFRHYVDQYLKNHQMIHQSGFTFLVRQLEPTPHGIPIELYVFTKDTAWANYEAIQADIFDHLLGVLPQFELRAFQAVIKTL